MERNCLNTLNNLFPSFTLSKNNFFVFRKFLAKEALTVLENLLYGPVACYVICCLVASVCQ